MSEFSVEQVRLMRSEISDEEFLRFIAKNPGHTWSLDRPIVLEESGHRIEDTTFVFEGADSWKMVYTFPDSVHVLGVSPLEVLVRGD